LRQPVAFMILLVANVLSETELQESKSVLASASFVSGRETAGWHAALVKHNVQADPESPAVRALQMRIDSVLRSNALFELAARPRAIAPLLFSRYTSGMAYGSHVDDAVMGREARLRSDVSLTLFLSAPEEYEGGELVIESSAGEQSYKPQAGSLVLYPSSSLHRVEPVRRGTRLAAVSWVQSLVRDPAQRELLFTLDTARRSLFEREGKSQEFDQISLCLANLMRMWVEL
jgi:PKHD-type hydroxylase